MTDARAIAIQDQHATLRAFNAVVDELRTEYRLEPGGHRFGVNGLEFRIPAGLSGNGFLQPDAWIARKHVGGKVHEPGMIAALLFLRDRFAGQKIAFFDVGALFGYFSFFARACFGETAEVHAVEANPHSAAIISGAIAQTTAASPPVTLHNVLIGDSRQRRLYLIDRFVIRPFRLLPALRRLVPQLLLRLAARLSGRSSPRHYMVRSLEEVPLAELVAGTRTDTARPIVKIDTEGHQAMFLPPATRYLIERDAVLLMEFDDARIMRPFGVSNLDLCRPFLRAGYTVLWLPHRQPRQRARILTEATHRPEMERSSLAVLLPPH